MVRLRHLPGYLGEIRDQRNSAGASDDGGNALGHFPAWRLRIRGLAAVCEACADPVRSSLPRRPGRVFLDESLVVAEHGNNLFVASERRHPSPVRPRRHRANVHRRVNRIRRSIFSVSATMAVVPATIDDRPALRNDASRPKIVVPRAGGRGPVTADDVRRTTDDVSGLKNVVSRTPGRRLSFEGRRPLNHRRRRCFVGRLLVQIDVVLWSDRPRRCLDKHGPSLERRR